MVGKSAKIFYCLRWPFKHFSLSSLIFEIRTPELLTEVTCFLVNKVHREIQFNRTQTDYVFVLYQLVLIPVHHPMTFCHMSLCEVPFGVNDRGTTLSI